MILTCAGMPVKKICVPKTANISRLEPQSPPSGKNAKKSCRTSWVVCMRDAAGKAPLVAGCLDTVRALVPIEEDR